MTLPQAVVDFYLTRSPYAKSDKPDSRQSINLSSFGWEKTHLDTLMKWILVNHLREDGAGNLTFSISDHIANATAQQFGMLAPIQNCTPFGGAFCIKRTINATEDNLISCVLTETYATCFFRHIRNSIAHGNYVYNEKLGLVRLIDQASNVSTPNPKITAIFLTSIGFLQKLAEVIENGPEAAPSNDNLLLQLNGATYRIMRNVKAQLDETDG